MFGQILLMVADRNVSPTVEIIGGIQNMQRGIVFAAIVIVGPEMLLNSLIKIE